MSDAPAPALSDAVTLHLVVYDGVCGVCSALVQFLLARDRRGVLVFAPLQSRIGRQAAERGGGDPDVPTTLYVVEDYRSGQGRILSRSDAALFLASQLGWPWKLALLFRTLPTGLRDAVYNLVAAHRYRVLGRREHCLVPRPEHRARFVDQPAQEDL